MLKKLASLLLSLLLCLSLLPGQAALPVRRRRSRLPR
jgi:hypothetical protein